VVGFSGRALIDPAPAELQQVGASPNPTRSDEGVAKYVNSPESPIYRKRELVFGLYQARQSLRTDGECLLVEGNFDVVSLHAQGLRSAVAPLGTAFTVEQARQIKRFCPSIVLLFDGDEAGRRAVRTAREPCREAALFAKVGSLPDGTDPDEFCRTHGPDAVRRIVSASRGVLEHLVDSALASGFSALDLHSKAAKIKEVAELIRVEDDPAVRALAEQHADRIAQRLGISDVRTFRMLALEVRRALEESTDNPQQNNRGPQPQPPARARSPDRREAISEEILGALLDYPELLDTPEVVDATALIEGDLAAAIAALRQWTFGSLRTPPEEVLAKLPSPIHSFALARLAAPRHDRLEDARTELFGNLQKLKRLELERRKSEVVEELQRVAATGDFEQELVLLRDQMNRARERHGLGER
jgi:DNA primase